MAFKLVKVIFDVVLGDEEIRALDHAGYGSNEDELEEELSDLALSVFKNEIGWLVEDMKDDLDNDSVT